MASLAQASSELELFAQSLLREKYPFVRDIVQMNAEHVTDMLSGMICHVAQIWGRGVIIFDCGDITRLERARTTHLAAGPGRTRVSPKLRPRGASNPS